MKFLDINGSSIPLPESYGDVKLLIQSDYYRCKGRSASWLSMWMYTLWEPSFRFLFWFRMASYICRHPMYYLSKWMHRRNMFKYGLIIPSTTRVGFGLYIGHPLSIVVNPTAVIGNNVNLSQFVTIGSNHQHAAVIGDNVYVGPSVSIVEDVVIGNDTVIGAGAVVTKSLPDHVVAVGNPAREVKSNIQDKRYIANPYTPQ